MRNKGAKYTQHHDKGSPSAHYRASTCSLILQLNTQGASLACRLYLWSEAPNIEMGSIIVRGRDLGY